MNPVTRKLTLPFLATITTALMACSTSPVRPPGAGPTPHAAASARADALTRELAATRAKQVQKVAYALWFSLDADHPDFTGRAVVNFSLKEKARDASPELQLDLEGATIRTLTLNGTPFAEAAVRERYDGHRLVLSIRELQSGNNRVEIAYSHPYSSTGNGLHRFKDPVDGAPYLYTNLEPYFAHHVFPCFDQPDLKASYELTVEAPQDWKVVANTLEGETTALEGRRTSWAFPPSPVFSTYVFALHAGPFAVWKSKAGDVPLRLFARKSLAKYVEHREWLEITRKGLDFYEVEFGVPYPYGKYDQLIVPDFNAGAMENVGAVTFSERYVPRTRVTEDRRRNRAETILHEMAHMWFGNLVTMRWWNGLWLNESFATFLSAIATDKSTRFKGTWQAFHSGAKEWAYWEDQLVTTHPIEVPVPDTQHALANFDGITYGKGAAALKQLRYFVGDDNFREGVQRYFQHFAHRNTALADFVRMVGEASGRDLGHWQKTWLQSAGLNTLEAEWSCSEDGTIQRMTLKQGGGELRPHRTRVALYALSKSDPENPLKRVGDVLDAEYSGASTEVTEAAGLPCPDLVFPNHEDYDYVKVRLDPKSLKTVRKSLSRMEDPLTRQMLWGSLWEMVVDGSLPAQEYAETALAHAGSEKDTQVLGRVLEHLAAADAHGASVLKYTTGDTRRHLASRTEALIRAKLKAAPAGSDLQLVWFHALLEAAGSRGSVAMLQALLDGSEKLGGFAMDQERRWEVIEALARNGAPGAAALIARELKKDPTDMGRKASIAAEASLPDAATKRRWLALALRETPTSAAAVPNGGTEAGTELKPALLREAMAHFHLLGQEPFSRESVEPFFSALPRLAPTEDEEYLSDLSQDLFPALCDPEIIRRTTDFLSANPALPASIVKNLRIARQEEERCVRARALSQGAAATPMAAFATGPGSP